MNNKQLIQRFEEITKEMVDTIRKKNHDYSGDATYPFKNFQMVENMGFATTEQGFLTRIVDKVMRISTFVSKDTLLVETESVHDTLMDLANYCILMACYLEDKTEDEGSLREISRR